MRKLDYLLQRWRYSVAIPFIPLGCDLLDIGGFDGSFLKRVHEKIHRGVCIDPHVEEKSNDKIMLIKARFDRILPFPDDSFDIITMFAVYEHLGEQRKLIADESFRVCRKNGFVLLTVPSNMVDTILMILKKIRLIDGMSLEEHEHFNVSDTVAIFETAGFRLRQRSRFQMGLNNLFIFQKTGIS
ncbi:MAG TPA: methyltransferase domain-containing protein [Nitrospirota bacterium]|nr:methyltransferase domain-containing protein [Nitrospirota bacterium]